MKHLRRRLGLCAFASLLPLAAGAQTATLVRDIHQGEGQLFGFGPVFQAGAVPGHVFFPGRAGADDDVEMWTSDGTAEGTFVLEDVCPGPCSSEPRLLDSLNGAQLWAGLSDDRWPYLWRSDGTRAGTYQVVEERLRFGSTTYNEQEPIAALSGGSFYFVSTAETNVDTLWRTDGTRAGTRKIHTFEAGLAVASLQADQGRLFLVVRRNPPFGDQTWSIWASDGTAAGTRSIHELDQNLPRKPTVAAGHLFFVANGTSGQELWASDGTAAGTRAITDFAPPSPFGDALYSEFFRSWVTGGHLFFVADDVVHGKELYESDGTAAGTRRITDFGTDDPLVGAVAHLGSHTVFTANDDLGHAGLWSTTGDPASTLFLPLPCGSDCRDEIRGFVKVGSRVVVLVQADYGIKILSTDGTPAGTRLLRDGCPDDCDVFLPENLPAEVATLPFATSVPGALWVTDGTPAGTRKRANLPNWTIDSSGYTEISAGSFTLIFGNYRSTKALWALGPGRGGPRLVMASAANGPGTNPQNLAAFQGRLAFTACSDLSFSLWRSTGTEESTVPMVELSPPSPHSSDCVANVQPDDLVGLGTSIVYLAGSFSGQKRLWRTDGTPGGTQPLTPEDLAVGPLVAGTGRVWFSATREQTVSVWTSDGTPAGTVQLASWPAGSAAPSALTAVGNELYFFYGDYDKQLWKSDGTPQGTQKVIDRGGSATTVPPTFTRVGSIVYYASRGMTFRDVIWRTDGTAAGTRVLGDVAGMDEDANPNDLIAYQGSLYFFAWTGPDLRGLWRSDGTAAGTVLLAEFRETGNSFYPIPHQPTVAGGKLFFVARDEAAGVELWVTDGTPAGTRVVEDIQPGMSSSLPDHLTAAGGRLFFTAAEGTYGRELWVSDGTAVGTRLVQDIAPFGASSEPDQLTVAGDRLYFTADDEVSGRELWSLPLSGPAGCQPSSTRLCLNGGRYQVEASWRTDDRSGHGTAVPLSGDTGYFWFFESTNVEAVVKVLDGQGVNGHVWVFYGALSDVDYTITVTDTQTGATRRYHNPAGQLASVGDTRGFGPLGAFSAAPETVEAPPSPLPLVAERMDRAATTPCQAGPRRLCLNGNRFAVEVSWKDFQGNTGRGTAAPLTTDTGTFWFFNAANVELVVKILDGRPINNKFWVFYGALSNVQYTITVTDTQTGKVKTYRNPSGRFASVADTNAF